MPFEMPPLPSLRTKGMQATASRWLMAERAVSAAITPKMGVGRCFLRVNRRGLCSRPTQSLERLHHGNSRRAISRDGGSDRTIRTCGKGVWRKRDAPSCGMWEIYEWATCWRGRSGALVDGGEARVATDLIHGVKNNAPIYCEIGHCGHNDVLFIFAAFRGAEKSFRPLSERTAASTV